MQNWLKLLVINDDRCLGASPCAALVLNETLNRLNRDSILSTVELYLFGQLIGCVDTEAMDMQLVT